MFYTAKKCSIEKMSTKKEKFLISILKLQKLQLFIMQKY